MRGREVERAIKDLLNQAGVKFTLVRGGRHPYVEYETSAGKAHRVRYSGTPGDHRAVRNTLAEIRRSLRD